MPSLFEETLGLPSEPSDVSSNKSVQMESVSDSDSHGSTSEPAWPGQLDTIIDLDSQTPTYKEMITIDDNQSTSYSFMGSATATAPVAKKPKFAITGFFPPEKQSKQKKLHHMSRKSPTQQRIVYRPKSSASTTTSFVHTKRRMESSEVKKLSAEDELDFTKAEEEEKKHVLKTSPTISPAARQAIGIKGIKYFTDEELDKVEASEKLYREFWNRTVVKLTRDKRFSSWTRSQIKGIIDTDWTLKRVQLMKLEIKSLNSTIEALKSVHGEAAYSFSDLKNTYKNEERMVAAADAVKTSNTKINNLMEEVNKCNVAPKKTEMRKQIKKLQDQMKHDYSELKKAQDALKKNLKSEQCKLDSIERQIKESYSATTITPMLSSVEEQELVEDINGDDSFGEDQNEETESEDKEKGSEGGEERDVCTGKGREKAIDQQTEESMEEKTENERQKQENEGLDDSKQ